MQRASGSRVSETIGERLRRLRVERGLSQRAISGPGISYAYVSRIEAGVRNPSVKAIRALARKLGVSPEYLERGVPLNASRELELRLADAELELRFAEDPKELRDALETILEEARDVGDADLVGRAHALVGLAAAAAGEHAEAIVLLERVAGQGSMSPVLRPDVHEALGRCYAALGRLADAVALFQECLAVATERASPDSPLRARFATYLSCALTDAGELERARAVLAAELERTRSGAVDPQERVQLYWSLARIAAMEGESAIALDYIRRAIGILQAREDTVELARAHVAHAQILILDDRAAEAGEDLERADRLLELGGAARDVGLLRAEQAKRAVQLGDAAEAVERAQEALTLLGDSVLGRGSALWPLAAGQVALGDHKAGFENFRQAVDTLEAAGEWRDAARAARDWGRALRDADRGSEAFEVLERAGELAGRIRDRHAANQRDGATAASSRTSSSRP
jgi:transcriptional regulator with XRE-family HTH domain